MDRQTPKGGIAFERVTPIHPDYRCSVCGQPYQPAGLRVAWVSTGLARPCERKPVLYCAKCDPDMRRG